MNNEKCMNCGTTIDVEGIDILPLKYGSRFDGWGTRVFLCKKCLSASPFSSIVAVTNKELSESSDATEEDYLNIRMKMICLITLSLCLLKVRKSFLTVTLMESFIQNCHRMYG